MKKINLFALPAVIILAVSCNSVPKAEEKPLEEPVDQTPVQLEAQAEPEQILQEEPKLEISQPEVIPQEKPAEIQQEDPFPEFTEPEVFELPPETEKTEEPETPQEETSLNLQEEMENGSEQIQLTETVSEQSESEPEQTETKEEPQEEIPQVPAVSPAAENAEERTQNPAAEKEETEQAEIPVTAAKEEVSKSEEQENTDESEDIQEISEEPLPSRTITIKRKQYLDVEYPGSGWYYMGENSRENKLVLFGRKVASEHNPNTAFTLRSRFEGRTILHFYKNDILTGKYIDDYLEVIIENEDAESKDHVKAPAYEEIVPPAPNFSLLKAEENPQAPEIEETTSSEIASAKPAKTAGKTNVKAAPGPVNTTSSHLLHGEENSPEGNGKTKIQTTTETEKQQEPQTEKKLPARTKTQKAEETKAEPANNSFSPENMNAQAVLAQAQKEYDSGKFEKALQLVTDFFEKSDLDLDRGLFLQGQILEAKSPVQDIKSAIDSYDAIVKNYRQSPLWKKANERSLYLKRFYINIR